MAGRRHQDCLSAFKSGKKLVVEQLLPRIPQPATITTTFKFTSYHGTVALVSLLHLAAHWGWRNVATTLVSVYKCVANCKDDKGHIPLHYAAYNGHLEVVEYFIVELLCNPMDRNKYDCTPLHYACGNGHLNIARYLIREEHCNPSCENNNFETPLHFASQNGHLDIAKYLIKEEHCNPSCEDNKGTTPLQNACGNGHLNIAQYLIKEEQCHPSCENRNGSTPLHTACHYNHAHIVQYLLSTGRVNPLAKNKAGRTALTFTTGKYEILKLFEPFEECRTAFPVHTFTKLILTGDSGAGKTTITELIVRLASSTAVECVDVQHLTAGIVPHRIESEQLGNFVIYDFAGQQEYYSSHGAVLEQVMRKSAAMFLCVVDLSESEEEICESLHYWLSFISNACSTAEGQSHVVIIGSHADQVTSEEEAKKSSLLQEIATGRVKFQQFSGYLSMDCRRASTDATHHLIATLTKSQKAIADSQPVIHYYSHVVYAFLRTKLKVVGCTLHDLISAVTKENDLSLPTNQSDLTEILTTLSDKGLIIFIHHDHQSSWVVVKTEALLKKINGTLFAPYHFKEHRDLASNTGIVPVSNLHKVFPDYNLEMLVGFLTSMNFCRPVDQSVLQYTNLQTTPSHSTADLLFFPGLVKSERPDSLVQQGALDFGWCLRCMDPHEFLSSRFLHLLLLSVAYEFPLASQFYTRSSVSGLQRKCTIWRNGIFWRDDNDTCTVIELLDKNRCVMVAMSYTSTVEYAKLRGSLIALFRHLLHKQHSPALEVCEFLISLNLVHQYPIDTTIPDAELFDMCDVARSILRRKPVVLSHGDGCGRLKTQSIPFEPYHLLAPSYVSQLFNPNMADKPVPNLVLQEVRKLCRQLKGSPKLYKELREHLDKLSLFAGRNPLVSSMAVL